MADYTLRHVGDCALSVEFAKEISLQTNQKVCALKEVLEQQTLYGVRELIPTYRTLLILYDPLLVEWTTIKAAIEQSIGAIGTVKASKSIITEIPVLYEDEYAMDIEDIAKLENKTIEEIIRIHSQSDYYVYMLGFSPGIPYGQNPWRRCTKSPKKSPVPFP